MKDKKFKAFYDTVRFVHRTFKTDYGLKIKRVPNLRNDADCGLIKKTYFLIRINKDLSESYSIYLLLHEVGHMLAWDKDDDDHGPNWGKEYSKVYRLWLKWFFEEEYHD